MHMNSIGPARGTLGACHCVDCLNSVLRSRVLTPLGPDGQWKLNHVRWAATESGEDADLVSGCDGTSNNDATPVGCEKFLFPDAALSRTVLTTVIETVSAVSEFASDTRYVQVLRSARGYWRAFNAPSLTRHPPQTIAQTRMKTTFSEYCIGILYFFGE